MISENVSLFCVTPFQIRVFIPGLFRRFSRIPAAMIGWGRLSLCVICILFGLIYNALLFAESEPLSLSGVRYWAYQLQDLDLGGAVQKIVNSQYDLVVIDPGVTWDYEFDAGDMVGRIKASKASDRVHRKLVIAYIDIGQAEEWRWYWDGHTTYEEKGECKNSFINAIQTWAPFVVACDPDGWAGNYPVAFWDEDWKDIVINGTSLGSHLNLYFSSMLDEVIRDGFDGIYLDWVEAWEMSAVQNRAQNEGKDPGQEMLNFIKEMRTYGKKYNPDFIVIQQNSSELIDEVGVNALKNAVDAIAQEGIWWDGVGGNDDWTDPEGYDYASCCTDYYLSRLQTYKAAGFPVFVCDYALQKADDVYQKAASAGFIGYATRRSLSRLTTTPPDFVVIQPPHTPMISIDWSQLYFGAVEGGNPPESRKFTISNRGEGTLNWSLSDNAPWLSAIPTAGIGKGQVTVSVDISGLDAGSYSSTITVADPIASNSPQKVKITLNIYSVGEDDVPFGSFDTPVEGAVVRSSIAVTGWALDDVGIDGVQIYRRTEAKKLIYIGDAVMVEGARTDIEQLFPTYPLNHKAGWGYMLLTNFLPDGGNGTYTLYAEAIDTSGNSVHLGNKTIICDNANARKPFGAIDTPTQGGFASGSNFVVWGWVLTPYPNSIPTDGSTINIYVDGINLGHPIYNIYRADIADLFPSYANSNGAAGYFYLDTTVHENGVHTLQWVVTDSAGNTDGIGSRYFVIRNSN